MRRLIEDLRDTMDYVLTESCLAKFINAYKSASSRLVKKEFPELKKELWKEYFWSRSYCLLTSGGAPIELIRQYIQSQGKSHVESIQV